jgi:hypothetical protein
VRVLRRLGLETTAIRDKVVEMRPPGRVSAIGRIPFTPRAKTAPERSGIEAELRGHPHIDAEHLLWGLSRQTDATATKLRPSRAWQPHQTGFATRYYSAGVSSVEGKIGFRRAMIKSCG